MNATAIRRTVTQRLPKTLQGLMRPMSRLEVALSRSPAAGERWARLLEAVSMELASVMGHPVQLRLSGLATKRLPMRFNTRLYTYASVELAPLSATCVLELDLPFATALLGLFGGGDGSREPAERLLDVEETALAYLLLAVFQALGSGRGEEQTLGARLVDVGRDPDHLSLDAKLIQLTLEVLSEKAIGTIRLYVPEVAALAAFNEGVCPSTREDLDQPLAEEIARATVCLRPFFGRTRLDREDLLGLALGDVVVLEGGLVPGGGLRGLIQLRAAHFVLHGQLQPAGFLFHRAQTSAIPPEHAMSGRDVSPPPLPIEVEVELARIRLSLGELGALKSGVVIPLHVSVGEAVLLRIGERAVAKAELVDIDGEIGARIVSLCP